MVVMATLEGSKDEQVQGENRRSSGMEKCTGTGESNVKGRGTFLLLSKLFSFFFFFFL